MLWTPSGKPTQIHALCRHVQNTGPQLPNFDALQAYAVEQPGPFWRAFWEWSGVLGEPGDTDLVLGERMQDARFFPQGRLNFAQNLLRRRDDADALIYRGEDGSRRTMSFASLAQQVASVASSLRALGIEPGDRIAAYIPNIPETIVAALATAAVGAVWSSCSPDFGVNGVLDRFGQITPKILFTVDSYHYAGKVHNVLDKALDVAESIDSLERIIVFSHVDATWRADDARVQSWESLLHSSAELEFTPRAFNDPLYIMFSSGTTGAPKCIVHSIGGTLLKQLSEHRLHCDIGRDDRVFYFSTCGWMMWNWLIAGLAAEASVLLFDGSPFHPGPEVLWQLAEEEGATVFGTSAKYLDAQAKLPYHPREHHDLSSVRLLMSTGSPLMAEGFDYVYEHVSPTVCLSSISGGTDILGCFVGGNPTRPVHRGQIQSAIIGMDMRIYDDAGAHCVGQKGELVCATPFPSMPIGFWGDDDGSRYHEAYFARYPGVWCHGDFAEQTIEGGYIIYGRSDATLNPGGVRIGTAEIYRQVEQIEEIIEALVIGQQWQGDVRVVLFVRCREGVELDEALQQRICRQVRANATPRHVPAKIIAVADIPRTKSGKIVELAVRDVVHGREIKNKEALANPEALELYRDLAELES